MVDEIVTKALEWTFQQGGGYVIAILVGFYAWQLDKRLREQDEVTEAQVARANQEIRELYEKRLGEFRELLDVMNSSTNMVQAMHTSVSASGEAINQLAAGFTTLLNEFHAQQARWDDRRGAMAKQLDDIQKRVEALQLNSGRAA